MVLSDGERRDLHEAIVEYLKQQGLANEAQTVAQAFAAPASFSDKTTTLEKKWNTLVRLNQRLAVTEEKCKRLQMELEDVQDPTKRTASGKDMLPREPCRVTFAGHKDTLTSAAFHPFEPTVYSAAEDGTVRVWDLQTRQCTNTIRHADPVSAVAVEPLKGQLVAVACSDQCVRLYEDAECVMTLHGHSHAVTSLSWLGDTARTLASASRDGEIRLWDTVRGASLATIPLNGFARALSTSGHICAVACDEYVHVIHLTSKQTLRKVGPAENAVQCVALSNTAADAVLIEAHGTADQKAAAKALAKARQQATERDGAAPQYDPQFVAVGGRDKNIFIFEIATGSVWCNVTAHDNWIRQVAFAANGRHLLSCSDDGRLCAFDLTTKKVAKVMAAHDHFVTCLALHPTGPLVATGSADNTLKVWPCG